MNTPIEPFRSPDRGALHDHLDDLANDVRNVDLRDRVHAASRRANARRRTVVASAAAAAVIAVASGVALAGLPSARRDPPVAVDSPGPTRSSSPAPPTPAKLPQTLYYQVAHRTGDGTRYDLRWWDGKSSGLQFAPPGPACGLFLSPDQGLVAWVAVDGPADVSGDLYVSDLAGNEQRRLLFDVTCTGRDVPTWVGPTALLAGQDGDRPHQWIDVPTGKTADSPFGAEATDLVWSPNARFAAYGAEGRIVVCRPDGTVIRRVATSGGTPDGGFTLQGISDDGRQGVLGARTGGPGQVRSGSRLIDTATGRNVALPQAVKPTDRTSLEIHPVPGDQLLVRADEGSRNRLYLLGADGLILDSRTEPATLHNAVLLTRTAG